MKQLTFSFRGHTAPPEILDGIGRGQISSICLFAYTNIASPSQVRELTNSLRQAAVQHGQLPPLIGIDQEGGQMVAIAGGATELPGNMALGATRSPELARKAGQVLGRELLAMGINLNFAPALDVNINPLNPVIGIRSFGDDPDYVSSLGAAMIQGLQSEGVLATAKHFPGHGDTSGDSHFSTPVVTHSRDRLNAVELKPFQAAINVGVGAVMTGHVTYTVLDDRNPATLSHAVLHRLLREEMGFSGLVITDAMDMHAVSQRGTVQCVVDAIHAGCDMVLLAHLPDHDHIRRQTARLENPQAVARIQAAQRQIPAVLPSPDVVGCAEHQQIARDIAEHAITLVRDARAMLPLRPDPDETIAVITVRPSDLTPADTSSTVDVHLADAVAQYHRNTRAYSVSHDPTDEEIRDVLAQTAHADTVVVGTIQAEQYPQQAALVRQLHARGQSPIVVSLRTPYDLMAFPEIECYLCSYSIRDVTTAATARVLFGEITAKGKLPCAIPGIAPVYP